MSSAAGETKGTEMAGNATITSKDHKTNSRSVDHFNTMKPIKSTRNSNLQNTEVIKELPGTGNKQRNRQNSTLPS